MQHQTILLETSTKQNNLVGDFDSNMTSEVSQELVLVSPGNNQENNVQRDLNMRSRSEVSVEERSIHSGKRSATDDAELPTKRRRCSDSSTSSRADSLTTDPSEILQEGPSLDREKRKASDDGELPTKRRRCSDSGTSSRADSLTTDPSEILQEGPSLDREKRKATDDGELPTKRRRCSDSASSTDSGALVIMTDESRASESSPSETISEHDSSLCTSDDQRIFQMSSSANTSRVDYEDKYCEKHLIGEGGFGSVFAGYRKSDNFPVAIKYIHISCMKLEQITCNGKEYNVIFEVAAMLKAAGVPDPDRQSAVISLLDWYLLDQELILVMERPVNSMDLCSYLEACEEALDEYEAKIILKELVDVALDMHRRDVFHRDIKIHNVLIQPDSDVTKLRVIDFGCGSFNTRQTYTKFCGTLAYFPPEWFEINRYWADPTTVWQLGVLYYCLLTGNEHFYTTDFMKGSIQIPSRLSAETKTLLQKCLEIDPVRRISLEELSKHFHGEFIPPRY